MNPTNIFHYGANMPPKVRKTSQPELSYLELLATSPDGKQNLKQALSEMGPASLSCPKQTNQALFGTLKKNFK